MASSVAILSGSMTIGSIVFIALSDSDRRARKLAKTERGREGKESGAGFLFGASVTDPPRQSISQVPVKYGHPAISPRSVITRRRTGVCWCNLHLLSKRWAPNHRPTSFGVAGLYDSLYARVIYNHDPTTRSFDHKLPT